MNKDLDIGAILDRLGANVDARLADLKARGIEPAPTDGQVHAGLPLFSFSLRWPDPGAETIALRLGASGNGPSRTFWGEPWPGHGAAMPGSALLKALALNWPLLAHGHLAGAGVPEGRVDFALEVGVPGLPQFELERDASGLILVTDAGALPFHLESVLVVEVLAALGDALAAGLARLSGHEALIAAWAEARAGTDLPPLCIEGDGPGARDSFDEETAWYARKLGVDPDAYRLAALDVHARQVLFAKGAIADEPGPDEYAPTWLPAPLPTPEEAMALATRAAAFYGMPVEDLADNAVRERNIEARRILFYGGDELTAE